MAVMWPRTLPPDVTSNMLRSTECEVFRRLEAVLDDSFVVFYSRPWLGLKPDGEEVDGECDFIVAHAELGMLTLEVKGGAVAYDPCTEQWTSRDRWKVTHNIKNPVQQARSAKHELLRKLNVSAHWKPRRIRARHGVVLPHSSAPSGDLGADMPQRIFCFAERFEDGLRDWILERFGDAPPDEGQTKALGPDGVRALEKTLAKPFQLRTPLGVVLSRDDAALQMLTQQQFHILRAIEAVPRAAISGGAGTGKTVLAMEEARRCAESGLRTLFVCYNRGLATEIRRLRDNSLVPFMTFHELCNEMTRHAGIPQPEGIPNRQLFEEIWPELLMQAFERLPDSRYDAIIVDEGQDFLPLWWAAVESGIDPEGRGLFRIFYDNNQRVYASATKLPEDVDLVPIRLTLNLRNTRRIHELVRQHYAGHEIEAVGPEGVEVNWIKANTADALAQRISDYVAKLNSIERVPPDDIAVLVATEAAIDRISPGNRLGEFYTARCDEEQSEDRIVVDSIRRFKGLERPVVVIAATPDTVIHAELPYVALSRARTHLVIVGSDKVLNRMRGVATSPFE